MAWGIGGVLAMCLLAAPAAVAAQGARQAKQAPDKRVEQARRAFEAGREAYARGALPVARKHFERAFELVPSPELAFDLARTCERVGDRRCAMERFRYYLKRGRPSGAERARIEEKLGALQRELEAEVEARKRPPPDEEERLAEARRFFEHGLELYRAGRYRAAYEAFVVARRHAPTPEILYNMARAAERLELRREARDLYRAYLRSAPTADDRAAVEARVAALAEH